jgi:hypothetical protein
MILSLCDSNGRWARLIHARAPSILLENVLLQGHTVSVLRAYTRLSFNAIDTCSFIHLIVDDLHVQGAAWTPRYVLARRKILLQSAQQHLGARYRAMVQVTTQPAAA